MEFRGKYAFLSNMYILPDGKSVEHYFQSMKCLKEEDKVMIMALESPVKAKRAGRKVAIVNNWNEIRESAMLSCLRYKFSAFSELKEMLKATGSEELIEENSWNDTFWGVCKGVGENKLGKLLMIVRNEIKGEEK